ncbi:MAG: UDP-N-acetylglucosamine 2-epimerase (non-hydrolyzing) [Trueperaceae bacterium]|nr:UDP-N-acetylglucosamine 2-epimerase (non-hydrolyzing) [Trueperaceae bacterium]
MSRGEGGALGAAVPSIARARVVVAFGTRPEASKMAPVIHALDRHQALESVVLVTGQHREQLDRMLEVFALAPAADLAVMRPSQSLSHTFGRIVPAAAEALRELRPDYVLVHGDTLTTVAVALAAFFEGFPVAHVEAGLRSFDLAQPFPEEGNRRLTDVVTDLDLPPTPLARSNLLQEGKREEAMVVTGNTAVDAVRWAVARARLPDGVDATRPIVAITLHRRENLPVLGGLAEALASAARAHPDHLFVYPMHRNPAVRDAVVPVLSGVANVRLLDDVDYLEMLALLRAARLVVTDSGGLQEEGAALGTPVAVLRNVTERPEGVAAGTLRLLGNEPAVVERELLALLDDDGALDAMRRAPNPFGDGAAGERVAAAVAWRLGLGERPEDWGPDRVVARAGS